MDVNFKTRVYNNVAITCTQSYGCSLAICLIQAERKIFLRLFKEYVKFLNRLYNITWFRGRLGLKNCEVVYEKHKLFQTMLYKYSLFKN
jgi:hypothetical protein